MTPKLTTDATHSLDMPVHVRLDAMYSVEKDHRITPVLSIVKVPMAPL